MRPVTTIVLAALVARGAAAQPHGMTLPAHPGVQADPLTEPLSETRHQIRPDAATLPVPPGYTQAQVIRGDRVFHGEAARGQCAGCHGIDGRGTPRGNDLTIGMFNWADGSVASLRRIVLHNMKVAPGMDGDLTQADVEAVAAYIWSLSRAHRLRE